MIKEVGNLLNNKNRAAYIWVSVDNRVSSSSVIEGQITLEKVYEIFEIFRFFKDF